MIPWFRACVYSIGKVPVWFGAARSAAVPKRQKAISHRTVENRLSNCVPATGVRTVRVVNNFIFVAKSATRLVI